jgi:hypothetical protein
LVVEEGAREGTVTEAEAEVRAGLELLPGVRLAVVFVCASVLLQALDTTSRTRRVFSERFKLSILRACLPGQ